MKLRSALTRDRTRSEAPIWMVSSGRAGSTLVHELLSLHPHVTWFPERLWRRSNPNLAWVRILMELVDTPLLAPVAQRALLPGEVYALWESIAPGFTDPRRDLTRDDVTPSFKEGFNEALRAITTKRRRRALAKVTGWPRVGFLKHCFESAYFVHVARDPRPVALSFLRVPWWRGDLGPNGWHWGALTPADEATWTQHGRSRLALSCIQMNIYWRALVAASKAPGAPVLYHVRYDALCASPVKTMVALADFCDLSRSAHFERALALSRVSSRDSAWRDAVSPAENKTLEEILAPCIEIYEAITQAG